MLDEINNGRGTSTIDVDSLTSSESTAKPSGQSETTASKTRSAAKNLGKTLLKASKETVRVTANVAKNVKRFTGALLHHIPHGVAEVLGGDLPPSEKGQKLLGKATNGFEKAMTKAPQKYHQQLSDAEFKFKSREIKGGFKTYTYTKEDASDITIRLPVNNTGAKPEVEV